MKMHKYVYPKWLEYPLFYPLTIILHHRGEVLGINRPSFLPYFLGRNNAAPETFIDISSFVSWSHKDLPTHPLTST